MEEENELKAKLERRRESKEKAWRALCVADEAMKLARMNFQEAYSDLEEAMIEMSEYVARKTERK